jgi:hypothetical protein
MFAEELSKAQPNLETRRYILECAVQLSVGFSVGRYFCDAGLGFADELN